MTDQASRVSVEGTAGTLLETSPVPVLVHDPETGDVLDANPAGESLFGQDVETLREMSVAEFSPSVEDASAQAEAAFAKAASTGEVELDWEITRPDGSTSEVEVSLRHCSLDGRGLIFAFVTDVSRRRKRERVLDGLHDVATELLDATTEAEVAEITTSAAEHVLRAPQAGVRYRDGDQLVQAAVTADVRSKADGDLPPYRVGEGFVGETYAAGEPRIFGDISSENSVESALDIRSAICVPLGSHGVFTVGSDAPGQFDESDLEIATLLTRLTTAALDQLDRESRLAERTDQLETLLNNAPVIFYEIQPDGTISESRGRGLAALGLEAGELVGVSVYDAYAEHEELLESIDAALDGERVSTTLDFGEIWLDNTFQPVFAEDGSVDRLIGVSFDITELKTAEEQFAGLSESAIALAESESAAEATAEAIDVADRTLGESLVAYWSVDREAGRLEATDLSDNAGEMLEQDGSTPTYPEGGPMWEIFERGETILENDFDPDESGGDAPLRSVILAPVGDHGLLSIGASDPGAFDERDRNATAILAGILRTTLDRIEYAAELEAYRVELERSNESLQQFAYVASHDLQEPLRMVSSYVSLLEAEYGDELDGEAEEYMEFAVDGARRMQAMIDDLLRYSRVHSQGGDPADVDASAVLDDTLRSLEMLVDEEDATIECGDLPAVRVDESQLGQLLQNLLKNAIQHGGETPTVIVDGWVEDDVAHITVTDDGPGIPESQRERIFEIFKSDSDHTESTGIGLAVCKRIANRHGGDISVESADGEGATFHVTLQPAVEPTEVAA